MINLLLNILTYQNNDTKYDAFSLNCDFVLMLMHDYWLNVQQWRSITTTLSLRP